MHQKLKTIIVGLIDRTQDIQAQESSLKEAELLVDTYGGEVKRVVTQNVSHRDSKTYIGSGKIQEIKQIIEDEDIALVVLNTHIKASQLFNLDKLLNSENICKVWDRTQLILQIFKKHASTAEAKLQIKLAELNHHGPELSGIGLTMSQQGGGIGVKGIGETQSEIMRRHWRNQVGVVKSKLDKVTQNRQQQMKRRRQSGVPTVAIIGYTNAGKTTLFNAIGNKKDKIKNVLFTTLDSSVSSVYLQNVGKEIYISDTIGFIQDLPTTLVEAFKSTLLETVNADILLHTIDCLDKDMSLKIDTVNKLLESLGLETKRQIYVFNKADKLLKARKEEILEKHGKNKYIFVSAKENIDLDKLIALVEQELLGMGMKRAEHLSYLDSIE